MRLLQNFTIRMVMLTILGLFCLLWSGVGLYSVHALSEVRKEMILTGILCGK